MLTLKVVGFVLLIAVPTTANAYVAWIEVEPETPVAGEPFEVTVHGEMSSTCWRVVGESCLPLGNNVFEVQTYTYDCFFREPGCDGCGTIVIPYSTVCTYMAPEPGAYTIRGVEFGDSILGDHEDVLDFEFIVSGSTPVAAIHWTMLKAVYR